MDIRNEKEDLEYFLNSGPEKGFIVLILSFILMCAPPIIVYAILSYLGFSDVTATFIGVVVLISVVGTLFWKDMSSLGRLTYVLYKSIWVHIELTSEGIIKKE